MSREVTRAYILAGLDKGVPESSLMEVLGVGRTTIWRTRKTYLHNGLEAALNEAPRPGKPRPILDSWNGHFDQRTLYDRVTLVKLCQMYG
jgi:hypothetical protein